MSERYTVPGCAACYSITSETFIAQTDWPVLARPLVLAWLTEGVWATGVGVAEVGQGEGAAGDEGVACVGLGTGADGLVSGGHTVCSRSTRRSSCVYIIGARINASTRGSLTLFVKVTIR